ncbi:hypothetical protein [Maricaulis alexandrii]|uniref:hypothetical protein n=1 Tax=Maricaulis alexandrii TaxID=2570354 RepID=UPI001F263EF6|nr:hypothetical protein [Maricaulis alexandrii]
MFPKMGNELPGRGGPGGYEQTIAMALRSELGTSHQAIKTLMSWTGASERSAKHWLSGTHGPSGRHLIALAKHSDAILIYILVAADRPAAAVSVRWAGLRQQLLSLVQQLDEAIASSTNSNSDSG